MWQVISGHGRMTGYIVYLTSAIKNNTLTWYAFKEHGMKPVKLYDHWQEKKYTVKNDHEYFALPPYSFFIFEPC